VTTETVVVVMPRLSDAMEEGTVVSWLKEDGDLVEAGEDLVEIETDKATMPYQAETAGVLHKLVQEGETVSLGAPLAELLPEGAEPQPRSEEAPITQEPATPRGAEPSAAGTPANADANANANGASAPPPAAPAPAASGNGTPAEEAPDRVPASPVARRVAAEAGIDLASLLPGSGPRGRVVKRDVEAAAASAPAPAAPGAAPEPATAAAQAPDGARGTVETDDLTRVQQVVARRMVESRTTVPDFSVEVDVDAGKLVELRARLKAELPEGDPVPSYNDFIVKACARALRAHPRVNGAFKDDKVERYSRVNVGVAVAAEGALLVPVVADADVKSLGAIAAETRRLAEAGRAGTLKPPELAGGTFTVSNLGMFGITRFTAVVNAPEAAILAVGALERRPVVGDDGELRAGQVMTLTLCSDHRILFGADAAAFLADIRAGLEEPLRLLV
jgi:pyruvate dehydrogenase E2 component (dihydrolipoamide acetyltransferase)